jgi:tetratricopeptide (TPR) repeat protein
MLRRVTLILTALAVVSHAAPTQAPAAVKLETLAPYREGVEAMSSRLWEVAAVRFREVLNRPDLSPASKKSLQLRLAETYVRAQRPAEALKVLSQPSLAKEPGTAYWKAQAFAQQGKLSSALGLLDGAALAPDASYRVEAIFSRAALLVSLGEPRDALEVLNRLDEDKSTAVQRELSMRRSLIWLELNEPGKVLEAFPNPSPDGKASEVDLLRNKALLMKQDVAGAKAGFTALLPKSGTPPTPIQHAAVIGLAEVLLAEGKRSEAADSLLAFIDKNRTSPVLESAFQKLIACLPDQPTPNDVILTRLAQWCPAAGQDQVVGTSEVEAGVFVPLALYYDALGQRRVGSAESKNQARLLLDRLRREYPRHPLVLRSLLDLSVWELSDGHPEQSLQWVDELVKLPPEDCPPALLSSGLAAKAKALLSSPDPTQAVAPLEEAAELLDGPAYRSSLINAAGLLLKADRTEEFKGLVAQADPVLAADLTLEKGLYLASRRSPDALATLQAFIAANPDHPRLAEARLAAVHAALEQQKPDLTVARDLLARIPSDASLPPSSLVLAEIHLASVEGKWDTAAHLAFDFLAKHADDPRAGEILFQQGRARFQNGDFNDARIIFEKLAMADANGDAGEVAWFFAARASAEGATSQAREESLKFFDKVVALNGPLSPIARMEKAEVMKSLKRFSQAADELEPWFKSLDKKSPLRLTAGLLLGEILYASAGDDARRLERTLAHYDALLTGLPEDSPDRFGIAYRRGLVLEQMKQPDKALDAYYSVLKTASRVPVSDWEWVDKCGVKARSMLEAAHRWDAAISIAEDHARLPSPEAREAAQRARSLRLEHMIYGEDKSGD